MSRPLAALVGAGLVLFAPAAHAVTATFNPTADGDVQVFGGDDVDTADTVISVTQSGGLIRNGIFEFDLSSIADTATINSAEVTFTLNRFISPVAGSAVVDIFAYDGDGVVDIADFDAAGTQVVDTIIPGGGTGGDTISFAFDTVAPITSALAGDSLTLRFETDSFASFQLAALENASLGAAQLEIDYTPAAAVPLPAALPLALGGIGLLAGLRARRQRA